MARGRYINVDASPENLRAIWSQIHDMNTSLLGAQDTIARQAATITALQTQIAATAKQAQQALITAGTLTSTSSTPQGSAGAQGGVDDGLAAQGCASHGADGHVAPGSPLTAVTAGQIICGTGDEVAGGWSGPALRAAAVDQATRDANVLELLLRVVYHLILAGFVAGRQRNPSGVLSTDKLTVQIGGVYRAYDIFSLNAFTVPFTMHAIQVFPASYVVEAGTSD